MTTNATTDRLPRLLALVPYLQARPGIRVSEAAQDLGVSEAQLRRDLELLWMCGLPGHGPGDLIDLSFEGDTVTVTFDAGMDRPLRLSADEALAIVVALRTLAGVPGLSERDAVGAALGKLEAAVGMQAAAADNVAVRVESEGDRLGEVRRALDTRRAIRLTYYVARRDETTDRVVDPMRLLLVEGRSYLEAWCRRVNGVRLFRLDRVDGLDVLDEPSAPPPDARPRDITGGVFQPSADQPTVTLRLSRSGRWVADYYACEHVEDTADGGVEVRLRVGDPAWLDQLLRRLGPTALPEVHDPNAAETVAAIRREATAALAAYDAAPAEAPDAEAPDAPAAAAPGSAESADR